MARRLLARMTLAEEVAHFGETAHVEAMQDTAAPSRSRRWPRKFPLRTHTGRGAPDAALIGGLQVGGPVVGCCSSAQTAITIDPPDVAAGLIDDDGWPADLLWKLRPSTAREELIPDVRGSPRPRRLAVALAAVLMLAQMTACESLEEEAAKRPVRDHEATVAAVDALAADIHRRVAPGSPLEWAQATEGLCSNRWGDEPLPRVYDVTSHFSLALPAAQHRPVLERLRDHWLATGWTGVTYRPYVDDRMELRGTRPDDVGASLLSGSPAAVVAVDLGTPCYRDPDPHKTFDWEY